MCARRFLAVIFVLTLIVVAGAFAIYQWGGNVLLKSATPRGHFEAAEAGGGPDYSSLDAWIARPEIPRNPAEWHPKEFPPPRAITPRVAAFYVHPTTYLDRDRWNAPLRPGGETEFRTRLFVQSQASAFANVASVWAPRYRQAAYGAFLLKSQDARHALDLAYADVRAAFDEFLRENPTGPILLAGHSQGSLHLARLLRERRTELKDRLVAAYVVGWPLSDSADLPAMGRRACTHPQEVGCILSWQSFSEPGNPDLILDAWAGTRGPTGVRRVRRDMVCVNPITGTRGGSAPPAANPGTLVPSADLKSASLIKGMAGAHCANGFLILDGEVPNLAPYVPPGNNYHVYDYALLWWAIARDADRRSPSWFER
jgi:hypothetical protein